VAGAYNDFWWDRGTRVAGRRSSLIIEPKNGRMPPLTPDAQKWADSEQARVRQDTRGGNLPASSYEDTDLWDRCLTRSLPMCRGKPLCIGSSNVDPRGDQPRDDPRRADVPLDGAAISTRMWRRGSAHSRPGEGDTLVVGTKAPGAAGTFAPRMTAPGMTLVERFTRLPNGNLNYQFA
jgi:hypothetical protein